MNISLTVILLIAIGSFVLGCACGTWKIRELLRYRVIYTRAKKIGLRDRGYVYKLNGMTEHCSFCCTRVRIGIDSENMTIKYCHLCGKILKIHTKHGGLPPPKKRGGSTGNVVSLHDHNKK